MNIYQLEFGETERVWIAAYSMREALQLYYGTSDPDKVVKIEPHLWHTFTVASFEGGEESFQDWMNKYDGEGDIIADTGLDF